MKQIIHNSVLLIILVISIPLFAFAQAQDIKFKQISSREFSPIVQDHEGYLWFGATDGLYRFDGYEYRGFINDPSDSASLSSNWVHNILVDRNGYVWIGTENGGLNRYDPRTEKFSSFIHDPRNPKSLSDNNIAALCEDAAGALWIGTEKGGLCRMDASGNGFVAFKSDSNISTTLNSNYIYSIIEDSCGDLWVGTSTGLCRLCKEKRAAGEFIRYRRDSHKPGSIGGPVFSLYEDHRKNLWCGTIDAGLCKYNRETDNFTTYHHSKAKGSISDNNITCMHEDRSGRMWIGTQNGGINIFDPVKNEFYSYKHDENNAESIYDNFVETICEDNTGTMWFGTYGGVSSYDNNKKEFIGFRHQANDPSSLSNNIVSDLWQDANGGIWAGTHGGGLNYLPFGSNQFKHFRHTPKDPGSLNSDFILCISGNGNNVLWIGTRDQGLNKFDIHTGKSAEFLHDPGDPASISGNCIIALDEDRDGDLWIGTNYNGLDRMDRTNGKFIHYRYRKDDSTSISSDRIMAILEDHSGYLWVGTLGDGLNRFDRKTETFTHYYYKKGDSRSLVNNDVTVLCEDSRGVLWVGTLGGISRYDAAANSFTSFTKQDGLVDNNIGTIISDRKKNLWITTNNGLSKFDPSTGKFRNFEKADGLPTADFNQESGCLRKDGRMFFGGDPGIVAFHPDSIHENSFIPPVVLTRFMVLEQPMQIPSGIQAGDEIVLSYDQNFFSFEFAALSYTAPEKNTFRYMLEGIDEKWVSSGTRHYAAYTHLSPGNYVFRVQGSNNDGVWNTHGASIAVRIVPPFWGTWWFRTMYIFLSFLSIVSVVYWRINYLRRRTEEQQKVSQQLIEFQENERKRIGTSLHDSLGQNLLVMKNLAVLGSEANKRNKSSDEQLGEISSLASQTLAEVREISYNLRPYHLDQLGLTGALQSIISRIKASSQITFMEDLDNVDNLFPKQQDINIFRIVQESINNIIKHSHATSAVIGVRREKDALIITVSDNGIGFDRNFRGFGLTSIAERVRILGGSLAIKSNPGEGTALNATIPIGKTLS